MLSDLMSHQLFRPLPQERKEELVVNALNVVPTNSLEELFLLYLAFPERIELDGLLTNG